MKRVPRADIDAVRNFWRMFNDNPPHVIMILRWVRHAGREAVIDSILYFGRSGSLSEFNVERDLHQPQRRQLRLVAGGGA